jgi:hypothetical protein
LGLLVPSIGHVGLMTILHPVADWLAIAAEAVSAMMAATGEDKAGLRLARNVDKGEAPTLLWKCVEIRLDENLDGLFARINLDTNGRVAKVDLVASSIRSSNTPKRWHDLRRLKKKEVAW